MQIKSIFTFYIFPQTSYSSLSQITDIVSLVIALFWSVGDPLYTSEFTECII